MRPTHLSTTLTAWRDPFGPNVSGLVLSLLIIPWHIIIIYIYNYWDILLYIISGDDYSGDDHMDWSWMTIHGKNQKKQPVTLSVVHHSPCVPSVIPDAESLHAVVLRRACGVPRALGPGTDRSRSCFGWSLWNNGSMDLFKGKSTGNQRFFIIKYRLRGSL